MRQVGRRHGPAASRATRCSTWWSSTASARGIVTRDLVTGEIERYVGDAVVLATGGYGNVFYLSTNAMGCNVTATWRAYRRGALLRQPLLHADPPDLHPGPGRATSPSSR